MKKSSFKTSTFPMPEKDSFEQGSFNSGESGKSGGKGDVGFMPVINNGDEFKNSEVFTKGKSESGDDFTKLANDHSLNRTYPK
jgi:hypothetical protein